MLQERSFKRDQAADDGPQGSTYQGLASQILDTLEQGVIVWSADATCITHNARSLHLLELKPAQLSLGTKLDDLLDLLTSRGDEIDLNQAEIQTGFDDQRPFQFEIRLKAGGMISAQVRPVRDGGHIVAFTDVTDMRQAICALEDARAEAARAEKTANEVLTHERARKREVSLLAQMDEWLQSCKSLEELYEIVTAFMQKILPGSRGQLFIYSNSRDVLEQACAWQFDTKQDNVTPDSCWALRRGRSYSYSNDQLGFVCDHVKSATTDGPSPEKFTCVPIVAHGDTVGLMHIEFLPGAESEDVIDPIEFTIRCGEHISMAIANVKLRDELQDQSTRDPLTGLYNRRYFLDAMRRIIGQTANRQGNFALLSIDADKFKNYNDEHGHDAGDAVLEAIAEKMCALDAEGAVACRIGGEEFCILLPLADRSRATESAEELRQSIEEMRVKYIGGPLPKVTVSIGIAVYPTHGTDPKELIKQADLALYAAKDAGRNCSQVADSMSMITFD
ncbi:diguanylate cyclase [Yoonia sp. BS5-3]|uniref:diguanylate cyclase n=1 Tax=Yoonia phaeophyticola TaxID=3137369 RepID=A0ABZ2V328_9RHOB